MRNGVPGTPEEPQNTFDRGSLCFACPEPDVVLHAGQPGFHEGLLRLYRPAESIAAEQLVKLKDRLRQTRTDDFFEVVTEGLAHIAGAQYAFVSKRILVDDEKVAVEMPPIGEPGACLMGAAFYVHDGHDVLAKVKNFKYHAYSCPCAYMKHDKVFIIPERLNEFIPSNPNTLAIPAEAYLGVPLCAEGKCFAHFGVMWSPDGAAKRNLRWSYLEMVCHSLEDMILERLLEGTQFAATPQVDLRPTKVVPHEAVTVAQSLKPYARSLSHELRTPMQGVVGMLDVMYATVQEAVEGHGNSVLRKVFETLKENIEVVQDSSRRAVEAADNVVHAYDMNMGVPESPESTIFEDKSMEDCPETQPEIVVSGNHMTLGLHGHGSKRRRDSNGWDSEKGLKIHATETQWSARSKVDHPPINGSKRHSQPWNLIPAVSTESFATAAAVNASRRTPPTTPNFASESTVVPGLRHASIRDVIQYVINDSLKLGGRPESAIAQETDGGEIIEVSMKDSSGADRIKMIEWSVDSLIPDTILIDERDLAKMISCVFLNAVKFTEEGRICLTARLNTTSKNRYIVIKVEDSGIGIPEAFLPNLFKAFSREDDSLTRQSEGLGLGLLVAKGLARKLGGDLLCSRSETTGLNRGSEFEIRVPLHPGEIVSRPNTPMGSRSPSTKPRTRMPSPHTIIVDGQGTPSTESPSIGSHSPMPRNPSLRSSEASPTDTRARPSFPKRRTSIKKNSFDRSLALQHPLNFLVAEDNKINRKLLVNMLQKLGYTNIREAYDGTDAVRQMEAARDAKQRVDVVLMDLWMPLMDGYEAAERILGMEVNGATQCRPKILAVSADVTDGALERAARVGMTGFMTKPYKLMDLEKLIVQYCDKAADESNDVNDIS